jgi:Raf kinase inhibitor-like YbhB/YbcL family protein
MSLDATNIDTTDIDTTDIDTADVDTADVDTTESDTTDIVEKEVLTMKLECPDIGETIPIKFTCDGEDISPALIWSEFPAETKSFAIAVTDPDAPAGTWVHWLVYNIPGTKTSIAEGEIPGIEVNNDFGKKNYGGPCPPSGTHRYYFTIYALSTDDLGTINNKDQFFKAVSEFTIAKAELISIYSR